MTERRRRFLFLSGLALVASTVLAPAWSSAATTPPPTRAARADRPRRRPGHVAGDHAPRRRPRCQNGHNARRHAGRRRPRCCRRRPPKRRHLPPVGGVRANAECDPANGETTVSWKVTNNGDAPVTITDNTEDVPLEPNPVPRRKRRPRPTSSKARRPISR